jgi:hypothetical protein
MREEVLEQMVELLASELAGEAEDLDDLENQVIQGLRHVGRGALQRKLEGKKGGTPAAGLPVNAGERPAS